MDTTRVLIVGAGGETGGSIVKALLESTVSKFTVIALVRPSSIGKPENTALKERGVRLVPMELTGPEEELVKLLTGIDVVISTISYFQVDQIPLATAARKAGVKRFVPCGFIPVIPPAGVHWLRDQQKADGDLRVFAFKKEQVYNHVKKLHLPYTIIDVGWWYQLSFPRVPSGRVDYVVANNNEIPGSGNQPYALTDLRDIGRYVAQIIVDPRTLNHMVFAYNEVHSPNQVFDLVERLSKETVQRKYVSEAEVDARIESAQAAVQKSPEVAKLIPLFVAQYLKSWGIRGDNTPEYATYLGYITSKDLYPDFSFTKLESYLEEVLSGKAKGVYESARRQH